MILYNTQSCDTFLCLNFVANILCVCSAVKSCNSICFKFDVHTCDDEVTATQKFDNFRIQDGRRRIIQFWARGF